MTTRRSQPGRQLGIVHSRSLPIWSFVLVILLLVTGMRLLAAHRHRPTPALTLTGPSHRPFSWVFTQKEDPAGGLQIDEPSPPAWAKAISVEQARVTKGRFAQDLPDGYHALLTLDPRLQKTAETLLRRYDVPYGAAVMIDVHSGNLLVMAGSSAADKNLGTNQLCLTPWAPAASLFKVITTSALLSENRAKLFTRVCYHGGSRRLTARHLRDDPTRDDQCDTLAGALAKSTNAIIAKLALKHLDRTTLLKYALAFGFNRTIDFVLPPKISPAAIPREPVARAKVAAGFWHTNLSPLHGALIAATIANRGVMIRPRILAALTKDGKAQDLPEQWQQPVISEFVAHLLTKAMVMTTRIGTARRAFYTKSGQAYVPWATVAGKTGSLTRVDPYVDYSWFIGFAPADHPKVAFAVLLGNPRRWRVKAAQIARMLLQKYGRLHPELRGQDRSRPRKNRVMFPKQRNRRR